MDLKPPHTHPTPQTPIPWLVSEGDPMSVVTFAFLTLARRLSIRSLYHHTIGEPHKSAVWTGSLGTLLDVC